MRKRVGVLLLGLQLVFQSMVFTVNATGADNNINVELAEDSKDLILKEVEKVDAINTWNEERRERFVRNVAIIITTLRADGYEDGAIAGIMGNFQAESKQDPYLGQGSTEYHMADVNAKEITYSKGNGIGLGQWSYGRRIALSNYCKETGNYITVHQPYAHFRGENPPSGSITYVSDTPTQVAFLITENSWTSVNETKIPYTTGIDNTVSGGGHTVGGNLGSTGNYYPALEGSGLERYKKIKDYVMATKYFLWCWEQPGTEESQQAHRVKYASAFMNIMSDRKLNTALGGLVAEEDAQSVSEQLIKNGLWNESKYVAFKNLLSDNITLPSIDDILSDTQYEGIQGWKDNLAFENKNMIVDMLRVGIVFGGILIVIWSILLFLCYELDKANNIIDIEFLEKVSFGKLKTARDDSDAGVSGSTFKLVGFRDIIIISLAGIFLGVLIISGRIFEILRMLLEVVTKIIG